MSDGNRLPPFPIDATALDLLWDAIRPGPDAERSSLLDTLEMFDRLGGSDPEAVEDVVADDIHVMRDQSYHPNDVIAALITEIRLLRQVVGIFDGPTPDVNTYIESEVFVAGALSTMSPFAKHHPAYALPFARRALEALSGWEPNDA